MAGFAITAFAPSIASSGIFSSRRSDRGVDSLATNPFLSLMNFEIAGGQLLNAFRGTVGIAKESTGKIAAGILSAEESIKQSAKTDKILRGVYKTVDFASDKINPLIGLTALAQVGFAKDKKEEAIRQGSAVGTMFAFEKGCKSFEGMPNLVSYNEKTMKEFSDGIYEIKNGQKNLIAHRGKYQINNNKVVVEREALYKRIPFLDKIATSFKKYCAETKIFGKSLKFLPPLLKGIGFALASIFGYKAGLEGANFVIDNMKNAA